MRTPNGCFRGSLRSLFFFQAEDGIRDLIVTGVQTCALPIYSPSNARSDGKFRRIRVVVDRPGIKVVARPGYFAPKDFRQFTREDKELQLEHAMDLDSPFVDLPMAVEAAYFRQPDNQFHVVLAAKIPASAASFLQKSVTHRTEFDFVWRATASPGRQVAVLR